MVVGRDQLREDNLRVTICCGDCDVLKIQVVHIDVLESGLACQDVCGIPGVHQGRHPFSYVERAIAIADVLAMSIARASRHFARVAKVHERLAAAERCGLGNVVLGRDCRDLEEGEWLRLRLSVEWTRASNRTWRLVDNPASGDHPADLADTIYALRELVKKGATAIVADQHEAMVAAAAHIALMPGPKGIK